MGLRPAAHGSGGRAINCAGVTWSASASWRTATKLGVDCRVDLSPWRMAGQTVGVEPPDLTDGLVESLEARARELLAVTTAVVDQVPVLGVFGEPPDVLQVHVSWSDYRWVGAGRYGVGRLPLLVRMGVPVLVVWVDVASLAALVASPPAVSTMPESTRENRAELIDWLI